MPSGLNYKMARVTFKTKDGKTVSFNRKTKKKVSKSTSRTRKRTKRVVKSRSPRKRATKKRKVRTMARRKTYRRRSSSSSSVMNTIIGGAIAGFVGNMIPYGSIGKVGVGYVAGKKGGMIGNTAKALAAIGASEFVQQNIGGASQASNMRVYTTSSESW